LGVRVRRGRPFGRAAAQHPLHPTAQGRRMYPPERGFSAALGFIAEGGAPRVSFSVGRPFTRKSRFIHFKEVWHETQS